VIVGVARWDLHLPGSHSLKDKRRIIKSLKDRLQQRYQVSAAEVEYQEQWQRAAIGAAVVSSDARHAEEVLTACDRLVESEPQAFISSREISFR
jgi:uncharacterized protein YlxP (DUF503 family)